LAIAQALVTRPFSMVWMIKVFSRLFVSVKAVPFL
jgi:hypothetical protein